VSELVLKGEPAVARDTECTEVVGSLRRLFPKSWLEGAARESG